MEYQFRKSALENEKKYSLIGDGLLIEDLKTGSQTTLNFSSVKQVHLKYLAKRSMPDAYLCFIKERSGKEWTLSSQHYAGIADFENRDATFSPFVRAMHKQLANHQLEYKKGLNAFIYWLSMVFFILLGLVAVGIGVAAIVPYGWFTILVAVLLFFRLRKHFKKNKPGTYDPVNIPEELLP